MKETLGYGRGRMEQLVYEHPYVSFAIFLAVTFAAMALIGLNDAGDRVAALGGV